MSDREFIAERILVSTPTNKYRHRMGPGFDVFERCWIRGDELEWRLVPTLEGEANESRTD